MCKFIEFIIGIILALFIGTGAAQYAECGMCGAHVSEWWYVQGASGSPVEVCHDCYLLVRDEEGAQR